MGVGLQIGQGGRQETYTLTLDSLILFNFFTCLCISFIIIFVNFHVFYKKCHSETPEG